MKSLLMEKNFFKSRKSLMDKNFQKLGRYLSLKLEINRRNEIKY